ncbi:hypothetical protein AYX14_01854 [Cryptococcus neoformans]|nr:hypothetical protein AYX14_01854 [Cryptococcus neoformans var. grubii]
MTKKARKQTSPIAHIVSIILAFVSTVLIFLVLLYNVPFSTSDESNLHGRMWLLTISPDSGRSGKTYGFGIWGWCSWADGVDGGDCVKKSFWQIPGDAGSDSGVQSLNLSGILAWGLPGIIIGALGAGDIQDGWKGELGVGWGLMLASMVLLILVQGLILFGGLWNNPSHSGRKK